MISRTSRHALNVLCCLARDPQTRQAADALSRECGVPPNSLKKILNQLRKQRFVEAEKGWGGGFRLRADALERPIRDVVVVFDGVDTVAGEGCILGLARCDSTHPCSLHAHWERIRAAFDEMLGTHTVRELPRAGSDRLPG